MRKIRRCLCVQSFQTPERVRINTVSVSYHQNVQSYFRFWLLMLVRFLMCSPRYSQCNHRVLEPCVGRSLHTSRVSESFGFRKLLTSWTPTCTSGFFRSLWPCHEFFTLMLGSFTRFFRCFPKVAPDAVRVLLPKPFRYRSPRERSIAPLLGSAVRSSREPMGAKHCALRSGIVFLPTTDPVTCIPLSLTSQLRDVFDSFRFLNISAFRLCGLLYRSRHPGVNQLCEHRCFRR